MEWISIKDRLPEKDGVFIVSNGKDTHFAERIQYSSFDGVYIPIVWSFMFCHSTQSFWNQEDVKFWMPLPEPPKE